MSKPSKLPEGAVSDVGYWNTVVNSYLCACELAMSVALMVSAQGETVKSWSWISKAVEDLHEARSALSEWEKCYEKSTSQKQ